MSQFRYQATDADGRRQAGEITARDLEDARRRLTEQGLAVEELVAAASTAPDSTASDSTAPSRLTSSDADEIVAQFAELGKAQIPLAIGLRAAAAEATNRRVKRALEHFAIGIDQGQSLEDVFGASTSNFPPHIGGLIVAATRTSQLGIALEELLDHHRQMRDVRRTLVLSLAYPILVIGLASCVFLFMMLDIVPVFGKMFAEFGVEVPAATLSIIRISDALVAMTTGPRRFLALGVLVSTVVIGVLVRLVIGAAGWSRFLGSTPLFGPLVTWSGAASFARMLGVLVDYDVPLPRALELTSEAVRDANVRETCRRLAVGVADGRSMGEMLEASGHMPDTLAAFVKSGEQQGDLASALRLASEVFVDRIGLRTSLINSISPPVIFVFVALGIGFSVIALFMPLLNLIGGLSW